MTNDPFTQPRPLEFTMPHVLEHSAHDDGIVNGVQSGCPRCLTYRLYELDDENLSVVAGVRPVQLDALIAALQQVFPDYPNFFSRAAGLPVFEIWRVRGLVTYSIDAESIDFVARTARIHFHVKPRIDRFWILVDDLIVALSAQFPDIELFVERAREKGLDYFETAVFGPS